MAAITLARAGFETTILERASSVGGGLRSEQLTIPGFLHDVCSAIHPLAVSSPAFARLPLAQHGLEWIHPPIPLAHPLDGGRAAVLERSLDLTAERLGSDGERYRRLATPFVRHWRKFISDMLQPPVHIPRHPLLLARFGLRVRRPAYQEARNVFRGEAGRALYAGLAAHSALPLNTFGSAAFGWMLGLSAHAVGWPMPRGGSQSLAKALASYFESIGGRIVTRTTITSLSQLKDATVSLLDVSPKQLLAIAGDRLPERFARRLEDYRYGPGAFKMDWALSAPIPWSAGECRRAGTLHVGGTLEEVAHSEQDAWSDTNSSKPFVLVSQPTLFDTSRAPAGKHTAWAYCHVPNGSNLDMTERIEAQIERFAPGFRDTILARSVMSPADLESRNPNLVGGDILGGAQTIRQLVFRPTGLLHMTPLRGVYLCSASTPPGGGVHGMCGYHAARTAITELG
jgi:phytoene dehydrogenase-like protein